MDLPIVPTDHHSTLFAPNVSAQSAHAGWNLTLSRMSFITFVISETLTASKRAFDRHPIATRNDICLCYALVTLQRSMVSGAIGAGGSISRRRFFRLPAADVILFFSFERVFGRRTCYCVEAS